LYSVWT